MNKYETLNFVINEILPLEEKHDCHIFFYYFSHTENVNITVHSIRWYKGEGYDFRKDLGIGHDLHYCERVKKEIEDHIIKEKSIASRKAEKIQRLKNELEELKGENK